MWKERKLVKDFLKKSEIEIKTGPFGTQLKAAEYQSTGIPVLNVKNLGFSTINTEKLDRVGDATIKRLKNHLLKEGDIVFGRKGAVERHAFITSKEEGWMQGSDCIRLRIKTDKINPRFLSYYFLTKEHREFMISMCSHGTTMASLNQKVLEQICFPMPKRDIQDKIVSILSIIDKKIELNKIISENLQQQAQAIYKYMFLDNPLSNWNKGTLSNIADIIMGQSPSSNSYNEKGIGTIFFQGRAEFGFRFPFVRLYTTEPKRIALAKDILISVRAPVGDINVAYTKCCIGRGLAVVRAKNNYQSFVLYTMFSLKKKLNVFNSEGTVFGSINCNSLNNIPVLIPSIDKIEEFEKIVAPMDDIVCNNYDEICHLQKIRDSLLPKLLFGEIDVSNL